MAKVINTVGSMSMLKRELDNLRITDFDSVKSIHDFQNQYKQSRIELRKQVRESLEDEKVTLPKNIKELEEKRKRHEVQLSSYFEGKLTEYTDIVQDMAHSNSSFFKSIYGKLKSELFQWKIQRLNQQKTNTIISALTPHNQKLQKLKARLESIANDFDSALESDFLFAVRKLDWTHQKLLDLYPLISGTIGESKVAKALANLPNPYVVINDVCISFEKPLYNKLEQDRIYSVQIDHIVVGPSGIFVIETKNWSESSLSKGEYYSPVRQVKRNGYALFAVLNRATKNSNIDLDSDLGKRRISVHNVLALTGAILHKRYEHVRITDVKAINKYIQYFGNEYSEHEIRSIVDFIQYINEQDK
jgi:hypothetical protein